MLPAFSSHCLCDPSVTALAKRYTLVFIYILYFWLCRGSGKMPLYPCYILPLYFFASFDEKSFLKGISYNISTSFVHQCSKNCCYQKGFRSQKFNKVHLRLGLGPRRRWGRFWCSPSPIVGNTVFRGNFFPNSTSQFTKFHSSPWQIFHIYQLFFYDSGNRPNVQYWSLVSYRNWQRQSESVYQINRQYFR